MFYQISNRAEGLVADFASKSRFVETSLKFQTFLFLFRGGVKFRENEQSLKLDNSYFTNTYLMDFMRWGPNVENINVENNKNINVEFRR